MHRPCSSKCCAGSRCQIRQQPFLGDAHRIAHSALRQPVFPLLPVFRGELRDSALVVDELSRFGQSMLQRMEILAAASDAGTRARAVKGDRCLHVFPDGRRDRRDLMPARSKGAPGQERPSVCRSADEGSGKSELNQFRPEVEAPVVGCFSPRHRRCVGKPLKPDRAARNPKTGGMKSYGGFGTYVGLGPKTVGIV